MEIDSIPTPSSLGNHSSTWTPQGSTTPISTAPSRKRSIDEAAFLASDHGSYFPILSAHDVVPPASIPEEHDDMLVNGVGGQQFTSGAVSSDRTVREAAEGAARSTYHRPTLSTTSRKSMRLSQSSIHTPAESRGQSPSRNVPEVQIDAATMMLGLGWLQVNRTDLAAEGAARGNEKFINNHFSPHIQNAELLLQNTTHNAWLVRSDQGFFLFDENLRRAQLVASTQEQCLAHLQSYPFTFENNQVLESQTTPTLLPSASEERQVQERRVEVINTWSDWNRLNNERGFSRPNSSHGGGGMDLD